MDKSSCKKKHNKEMEELKERLKESQEKQDKLSNEQQKLMEDHQHQLKVLIWYRQVLT